MRVLVVEDEPEVAEELASGLSEYGFHVTMAHTGQAALHQYTEADAVLLDLWLPDHDGFFVCGRLRAVSNVPILFVSARGDEFDRVLGLKLGADDYVVKPIGIRELAARVEAVVRRAGEASIGWQPPAVAATSRPRVAGPVRVDYEKRRVTINDREVSLTRKEFELLALLTAEPGKVFTHDLIMRQVWGRDRDDSRTLGVHVASLRRKLGAPFVIETVRGVGYRVTS